MLISYAQNQEDIILWRAFNDIKGGVYVDVGANDPIQDSVTKLFYDQGWRGMNIEPIQRHYKSLETQRPEDINLNLLLGSKKDTIDFYEVIGGDGLSTTNKEFAEQHVQKAGYKIKKHLIDVDTLDNVFEQYKLSKVHFLKIDVEGAEKDVLQGLNLKRYRPIVIIIESTLPNTPIQCNQDWEDILLSNGYECVLFDGLNRYYLEKSHIELKSKLSYPACPLDHFTIFSYQRQIVDLNLALTAAQKDLEIAQKKIDEIHMSNSWKITAPLRRFKEFF